MKTLLSIISRSVTTLVMLILVCAPGAVVYAEGSTCTPPPPSESGVRWPTGSDAGTFTYQCEGGFSGKWINAYYLYDPASNLRSPLYSPDYSYDCATNQWHKTVWDYSAASGTYYKSIVESVDPGGISTNCPAPESPTGSDSDTPSSAGNDSGVSDLTSSASALSNPGGVNQLGGSNASGTNNVGINNGTTATMHNGIISFADTGNALVTGNTTGGNAASGDAQVIANIINLLQSSSNVLADPNILTFTADINGDVNGDLLLDPSKIGSVQPANSSTTLDNNVAVNNSTGLAIVNDINLAANTGDAGVVANTSAGDAKTGTADAVANVVNVLNSAITAGQSFIGIININGNLNGDILLPPDFIDTLLASNVPRYSIPTSAINSNSTITNSTNQSISNTVGALAATGSASVLNNTSAGDAKTGAAKTNLTIFNLTGSNVVASNNLLVFVNVLGTWYGLIMNAPTGTTAASLGGGVTSNYSANSNASLNNDTQQSIKNAIRVASTSGDATVADNTHGGSATSGDATASVNLMNMINSSLSLNGWFGLLFINVFGTWQGSFGVDTAAGDLTPSIPTPVLSDANFEAPMHVFRFVPKSNGARTTTSFTSTNIDTPTTVEMPQVVLAAAHSKTVGALHKASPVLEAINRNYTIYILGGVLALAILLFSERHRLFHR